MYPIGDFLIQIKNAALARKPVVNVGYSRMKENTAKVLEKAGYVRDVSLDADKKTLTLTLVYQGREPVLNGLEIVSKPGLRVYKGANELIKRGTMKQAIVSTPKGILLSKEAKKQNLGGELIAYIW